MLAREIWFVDFEFYQPDGWLPTPLCMAAYEMNSKRLIKLSRPLPDKPPYSVDENSIFVAFAADADLTCHYVLNWGPFPVNIVDPHKEWLNYNNYIERPDPASLEDKLIEVLSHFHIEHIDSAEKEAMREIAKTGGPRTREEEIKLLDYCASDIAPLPQLFRRLVGPGNIRQAIQRGRYMKAVTLMQIAGLKIDPLWNEFQSKWPSIKTRLIAEVDKDFGVFDGIKFDNAKFKALLDRRGWTNWPLTPVTKLPVTNKETRKEMIGIYPELTPWHELMSTLHLMNKKKEPLPIGPDGRSRCSLGAFRAKTSRNLPKSKQFLFNQPSWTRSFARAPANKKLVYIDFMAEEFAIAAALSGDKNMQRAYIDGAGDPYLSFAKMAKALPLDATKNSHPVIRDLFKQCALGIQYAMGSQGLAAKIGRSVIEAEALIDHHKAQFQDFWRWVDCVLTHFEFKRSLCTKSGWRITRRFRGFPAKYRRSAQNWLIQSTGGDLLREVCCRLTEAGFVVIAPIHDAVVLEDWADRIEQTTIEARRIMAEASKFVLGGFEIFTEVSIFDERFVDKRGVDMWRRIIDLMAEIPTPVPDLRGTQMTLLGVDDVAAE
jgi:DNA polymerase family A